MNEEKTSVRYFSWRLARAVKSIKIENTKILHYIVVVCGLLFGRALLYQSIEVNNNTKMEPYLN